MTDPRAGSYSGPEAVAASGITYRQLDYWARTDLITPSLRVARGSGTQRRYSYGDVVALAIIARLLEAGMSLQSVRRSVPSFRHLTADDLDGRCLVLTPIGARLATGPELVDLLGTTGVFHVLPLGEVADCIDDALDRFDARRQERADRATGWTLDDPAL